MAHNVVINGRHGYMGGGAVVEHPVLPRHGRGKGRRVTKGKVQCK